MIGLIDMGLNNMASVMRAFERIGSEIAIIDNPSHLESASSIVLPGIGAFGDGMASLHNKGFAEPLKRRVECGVPILGICLGMQLLTTESDEGGHQPGLDLIAARTGKLEPGSRGDRVPNIGWCDVACDKGSFLYEGAEAELCFYFAHSYHVICDDEDVAGRLDYGDGMVTAAINHRNVYGVQFHPEKSLDAGLRILAAFANGERR